MATEPGGLSKLLITEVGFLQRCVNIMGSYSGELTLWLLLVVCYHND